MKPDSDVLRIDQLPEDTQCRKVTTEMEIKSGGKKTNPRSTPRAPTSLSCATATVSGSPPRRDLGAPLSGST